MKHNLLHGCAQKGECAYFDTPPYLAAPIIRSLRIFDTLPL